MSILRPFTPADILQIDELWRANWQGRSSMPNRANSIVDAVIEHEGEITAYGQVKLFAETMLFLDHRRSKRERVAALKLLMAEALQGVKALGIEETYAFIQDPSFARLISSRYGFQLVESPGMLLLKVIS